jgi:hypothetical protein
MFLVKVFASNGAGDSGLPSASHAIELEDTPFIIAISPCPNLVENVDLGILEA